MCCRITKWTSLRRTRGIGTLPVKLEIPRFFNLEGALFLPSFSPLPWMSAAAVAVVATSGERHEGKAGVVLFAGKTV